MKYLQKSFTVPACNPGVSQEKWDRIFGKEPKPTKVTAVDVDFGKCQVCGTLEHRYRISGARGPDAWLCHKCFKETI